MQEEGVVSLAGVSREGSWHGLDRRRSTPLLLNYAPLDFFEALSEGHAFNGRSIDLTPGRPPACASLQQSSIGETISPEVRCVPSDTMLHIMVML